MVIVELVLTLGPILARLLGALVDLNLASVASVAGQTDALVGVW